MKNFLMMTALLSLALSSVTALAADSNSLSKEEQEREERIRYNLRQGAFNLHNPVYKKDSEATKQTDGKSIAANSQSNSQQVNSPRAKNIPAQVAKSPLTGLSEDQIRDRLADWGVNYLFNLDQTDLQKADGAPFYTANDFMDNATAESRGGNKFQAQVCKSGKGSAQSKNPTVAARFERTSPQDATGAYMLVKEVDPSTTNLSAYEGFSVGSWIQIDNQTSSGAFPILSKSPLNQVNAQGINEWEFRVTGNVVYLNISRQGRTQNLSFNIPWWGDRFGSCYEGGIYRDCWHYVGISFDPSINKVGVLFLRKFANKLAQPSAESFQRHETSAQENAMVIESSRQTPLRIGASNSSSMNGILKGVFFARKALAHTEMKAMAQLTEPTKDGLFCNRR